MYVADQIEHIDTTTVTGNYRKWLNAGLDDKRRKQLLTP